MAGFRKIVVDGDVYLWKYSFDDYDWMMPSHLVISSWDKKTKIVLSFSSEDNGIGHCPFQAGLDAAREGETVKINLNRPRYVAEIIRCLYSENMVDSAKKLQYFDGLKILRSLGYRFEYWYGRPSLCDDLGQSM